MKKVFGILFLVLSMVVVAACGNQQAAEEFPSDQITLVIQAAPGGASDTISRTVAKLVEDDLGVPVVPVNKTGGAGAVAMSYLKSQKPDGYTIGYVPVELAMVQSLGYADLKPDDLYLLGRSHLLPAAITVRADAPYDTIAEFIAYAKKNPSKIRVGNAGTGSIWHVAGAGFAEEAGIQLSHVPFDGAAPAVTALMGKHVDAVSVSPSEVQGGVKSGDLKVLAVMGNERDALFPEVPTLKEEGIDVEITAWGGFAMPKGGSEEVRSKLESAIKKAIQSKEFQELAKKQGLTLSYQDPQAFSRFADEQLELYNGIIPTMELD
ncbi:tripartite tricarboxylate transporter substrate binding protein [Desmospora activa]|uniref:Tripartite-type tricarboxylate transporter receptor subunit TctC n=1 Tax=Desmospora activa DSM 45169 TaxID=1121389 RepID=A0A2T4ZBQ5_9BACL|nr:tripartite tricarboxylate transporter substrate binding protein [Desmospora activa]PTM59330.1 tripartite-type tricarboxylate transporter receptor subunit TctC [Desmospora activa DSM 45169]